MWFRTPATVAKEDSGATSIEYGVIAAPGVGRRDRGGDGGGRLAEHGVPVGVEWADDGGRWLNGINGVYPRVPPLDVMSIYPLSIIVKERRTRGC